MYGDLTLETLSNTFSRYAKNEQIDKCNKQFAIYTESDDFKLCFYNLSNFKIVEKVTFKQVMNIGKIDWFQVEAQSTPYIQNTLKRLCDKHDVKFKDGQILISMRRNDKNQETIYFHFYSLGVQKDSFRVDYIFGNK